MSAHILVIDQGTTSTRAIVFDRDATIVAMAQREFPQIFPHPGWVEHDPEDLWSTTLGTIRMALDKSGLKARDIAAIGIANQRETALLWDRSDGRPIFNAVVWQDRRTADVCQRLKREGCEPFISERAGLLIDPYFSATKIAWMLDAVPGARARADRGELAFGTVDAFLVWRLTGGRTHATDATNASRTMLFDIRKGAWDDDLLRLFDVPRAILPDVRNTSDDFGLAVKDHLGHETPIAARRSSSVTRPSSNRFLLRAYGRFVASLGGRYITACDVGTRSEDMDIIARECRWVTGRTTVNGGAGDSSVLTALGVMHGMRAAAEHAWGSISLRGRTVGVEGVGKVGHRLVDHLIEAEANVVVCDVSAGRDRGSSRPSPGGPRRRRH